MKTAYLYTITRRETGDQYVGITNRGETRWSEHKSQAKAGRRSKLANALRKHGFDAFNFQIVAQFPTYALASLAEQTSICFAQPKYNITAGGEGTPGLVHSAEARARMSEDRLGNQNNLGNKASDETRAKMSAAARGRKKTAEHRAKIGAAHVGMKRSPEARARMSAAQKASFARRKAG